MPGSVASVAVDTIVAVGTAAVDVVGSISPTVSIFLPQ